MHVVQLLLGLGQQQDIVVIGEDITPICLASQPPRCGHTRIGNALNEADATALPLRFLYEWASSLVEDNVATPDARTHPVCIPCGEEPGVQTCPSNAALQHDQCIANSPPHQDAFSAST